MKSKEELSALKEETEALNIKHAELTDEELKSVTGGFSQNDDGTYNIYYGDVFQRGNYVYTAEETKLNATLETEIWCEYGHVVNGLMDDWGKSKYKVSKLLGIR